MQNCTYLLFSVHLVILLNASPYFIQNRLMISFTYTWSMFLVDLYISFSKSMGSLVNKQFAVILSKYFWAWHIYMQRIQCTGNIIYTFHLFFSLIVCLLGVLHFISIFAFTYSLPKFAGTSKAQIYWLTLMAV